MQLNFYTSVLRTNITCIRWYNGGLWVGVIDLFRAVWFKCQRSSESLPVFRLAPSLMPFTS